MQIIKSKTVVKLSKQELEDAVRLYVDKEKGFWIDEFDIEVDGIEFPSSWERTKLQSTNTATEPDSDGWFAVPRNWNVEHCPNRELAQHTIIEVLFRNGSKEVWPISNYKVSWVQENDPYDIVKYRVIEY